MVRGLNIPAIVYGLLPAFQCLHELNIEKLGVIFTCTRPENEASMYMYMHLH